MENNKQNDPSFKARIFLNEARDFMVTLNEFGILGEVLKENQASLVISKLFQSKFDVNNKALQ